MRVLVVLILLAGCAAPAPGEEAVTARITIMHPDGPELGSTVQVINFSYASRLGEHEEALRGACAGETRNVHLAATHEYAFTPRGAVPLAAATYPVVQNLSIDEHVDRFRREPVLGEVNTTTFARPVDLPVRTVEVGARTGQQEAVFVDGRVEVTETVTMHVERWGQAPLDEQATRSFDGTDRPEFAGVNESRPRLVRPIDVSWVHLRLEVEDGSRHPYGAMGGWLVANVQGAQVDFTIEPVEGLIFSVLPDGQTRAARLDPLGLGVEGSYKVLGVDNGTMLLGHNPRSDAFLFGQDLVHVAHIIEPAC